MVRSSTRDSRTSQSECRSTSKKTGQQRAASISQGWGSRIQMGSGGGGGGWGGCNRQLQIHAKKERDQTTVHQQQKKQKQIKVSTAVQTGRGDARRGVRPQTGGAEAERIAATGVRSTAELGQCANLKHTRLARSQIRINGSKRVYNDSGANELRSNGFFMLRLSISDKSPVTDTNRNNVRFKNQHEDRPEIETEDVKLNVTYTVAH